MNKLSLVLGGAFIGAGVMMIVQDRRINKIHKMYANLIAEHTTETYTQGWTDGNTFGVQQYRREAVLNAVFN